MSPKASISTTNNKGKAPATRQQSAAIRVESAGRALRNKKEDQKTSVDTTLEEEEDNKGTKEKDKPSARAVPASNPDLDDQYIEALRDDPEALSNILAELC